jgi:hypothetical protein
MGWNISSLLLYELTAVPLARIELLLFVINNRTKFESSMAAPGRLTLYVYEFYNPFLFLGSG